MTDSSSRTKASCHRPESPSGLRTFAASGLFLFLGPLGACATELSPTDASVPSATREDNGLRVDAGSRHATGDGSHRDAKTTDSGSVSSHDGGPPAALDASTPSRDSGSSLVDAGDGGHRLVPRSMRAYSSAIGYPIAHAFDDDPSTVWLGGSDPQTHRNYNWVEVDLGARYAVDTLVLQGGVAPYPGAVPTHFAVFVSDDASRWDYAASFFAATTVVSAPVEVDATGRYLRIEISRVADGTGWTPGVSEIELQGRPTNAISVPPRCDLRLNPLDGLASSLALLNGDVEYTICLEEGVYEGPIQIRGVRGLRILGLGDVRIEANRPGLDRTDGTSATMVVRDTSDFELDGVHLLNRHVYVSPYIDQRETVSRALQILDSRGVTVRNATLQSFGKQTVQYVRSPDLAFEDVRFSGAYFVLDANYGGAVANRCVFETDLSAVLPGDQHAVLWVYQAPLFLRDATVRLVTGAGLVAGAQEPNAQFVRLSGRTVVSGLRHWVQVHPNYPDLRLQIGGDAPTLAPFRYNPSGGGGISPRTEVCVFPLRDAPMCQWPSL